MGASQSSPKPSEGSRILEIPIPDDANDTPTSSSSSPAAHMPTPTGSEYDLMDKLINDLPNIIDDESRAQVEEYMTSCDGGKGPMVACFSTAEYISLFLRKHGEAAALYENACFRSKDDKSPNGVEVIEADGKKTKAYPPACFNLGQMRMTGKGRTKFDRKEGYDLFDRGCKGGHGGACFLQAKMLASYPGSMGEDVPYDVAKAAGLMEKVCLENNDSVSCFTLASMLLRGENISPDADNATPAEAMGQEQIKGRRVNEIDRRRAQGDERSSLKRDPKKAEMLLAGACERGHAPSCYNLAVMYEQGDDGVPRDIKKAQDCKDKTETFVKQFGGFGGLGGGGTPV